MPDLNPNDDYIPVAVPAQDMGIHQEQIKAVMGRRIQAEETANSEYDVKIQQVKDISTLFIALIIIQTYLKYVRNMECRMYPGSLIAHIILWIHIQ